MLNQAASSARNEMYKAYKDTKEISITELMPNKVPKAAEPPRYKVTIKNSSGLLCDTKYDLKNKMLKAFRVDVYKKLECELKEKNKCEALTEREIKILKSKAAYKAKEIVSKTYVDNVFNEIRERELRSVAEGSRVAADQVIPRPRKVYKDWSPPTLILCSDPILLIYLGFLGKQKVLIYDLASKTVSQHL